jgi:hydroxymethylbilane synthase
MSKLLRIGTRESQLAVWQATLVKDLLAQHGFEAELVYIKSEGDIDLKTPLYEMNVQGIFTRSLDIALLHKRIDLAVHSMKDVPTVLPQGIIQSAVLKRGSHKDILVLHPDLAKRNNRFVVQDISIIADRYKTIKEDILSFPLREHSDKSGHPEDVTIATSSIRRIAQWLNRYPRHQIENLRGNVNTRLRKLKESNWHGAIFAAAGLERINLRPENSIDLDWMLPAPAQGAIMVVCRQGDDYAYEACRPFNHEQTTLCTQVEKDFLRALAGGCSTPISALAEIKKGQLIFKGNIFSVDGKQRADIEKKASLTNAANIGIEAAKELLNHGGKAIADTIPHEGR